MPANKQQLIRLIQAEWQRATGHQYRINLEALQIESLQEFCRLMRDIDWERRVVANRARMMPWRRG